MGQISTLRRVFVVEDESLVAMLLEDMLRDLGWQVVGLASRLGQAEEAIKRLEFDCALLDVNVAGEPVYPLAERLRARGTPFVFVTGYSKPDMLRQFRGQAVLRKPFKADALARALAAATADESAQDAR